MTEEEQRQHKDASRIKILTIIKNHFDDKKTYSGKTIKAQIDRLIAFEDK